MVIIYVLKILSRDFFFFISLLHIRSRCVDELKMPDLAILLTLEHGDFQTQGNLFKLFWGTIESMDDRTKYKMTVKRLTRI